MMQQALVAHLAPLFNGEVYLGIAPQKAKLPRAVYVVVSQDAGFTLAGHDGYLPMFVQIDCWASTAMQANECASRVFKQMTEENKGDFTVTAAQRLADTFDETLKIYACRWEYRLEAD